MPTPEELRTQLAVAELEERLVALKDSGDEGELRQIKDDLRYVRWIARGGPTLEKVALEQTGEHTNRAVADLYSRWLTEGGEQ